MPEQIGKSDACEDGGPVVEIGIGVCHGVEQHEKQRQGQEQRIQTQEAAQGELPRGIAQHAGQDDEAADGEKQIDAVDAKLPWPEYELDIISEERRVGKEWVRKCSSWWVPFP